MQAAKNISVHFYPTAALYIKDIKDIVNIFSCNIDEVKIQIGNNILSDIDEMEVLKGETFNSLSITGRIYNDGGYYVGSSLSLDIKNKYTSIHISEDHNVRLLGLQQLLEERLKENYRKLHILGSLKALLIMEILSFISLYSLIRYFPQLAGYSGLLLSLFLLIPFAISFGTPYFTTSKITIAERSERPSFWERNKDALIRDLFVSLFSVIMGVILGYFLGLGK